MEHSPYRLTLLVCLAEILGLVFIWPFFPLCSTFQVEWDLNNTAAGWISAAYYAGYMVLVPVLAGVTDRLDARKIMGLGALLGILSALGYAFEALGVLVGTRFKVSGRCQPGRHLHARTKSRQRLY